MIDAAGEWVFNWLVCLPLTLTWESKSPFIRVLGVVAMFPWFPFMGAFSICILLPLLVLEIFVSAWNREL